MCFIGGEVANKDEVIQNDEQCIHGNLQWGNYLFCGEKVGLGREHDDFPPSVRLLLGDGLK